jgi:hypothetical protein
MLVRVYNKHTAIFWGKRGNSRKIAKRLRKDFRSGKSAKVTDFSLLSRHELLKIWEDIDIYNYFSSVIKILFRNY